MKVARHESGQLRSSKIAKSLFALAFAAFTSGCVSSSSDYLEGVATTNANPTAQQTAPIQEPTQSQQLAPTQPPAVNTPQGYVPVPLGSALPSPKSAQNYLPDNDVSTAGISSNQLALLPSSPSTAASTPLSLSDLENETPANGVSIGLASVPEVDPVEFAATQRIHHLYDSIDHGKCHTQWAPRPKRVEAKRIIPGDPYYVEFRMRNTPLMPVGHTFVVYGRLDGNGNPIDERMAMLAPQGGYYGASLAAALPVPGVLKPYGDDCKIRPETAYRVSLNAARYEKLLKELQKAKSETAVYMLFAQNCNHFTQRMANAVGIRPPRNRYVPAVDYLYDMIEANEGIKIDTRFRSKVAGMPDWPTPAYIKRQRRALANNQVD